jgi:hypothetical protein
MRSHNASIAGRAAIIAVAIASAIAAPCPAQETEGSSSFSLGGTVEARPFARYAISSASLNATEGDLGYGSEESLGLELSAKGERARAAASIETSLLTGQAAASAWAFAAAGLADRELLLVPAYANGTTLPDRLVEARLRTLYAKLDLDWASITAGRQVVNYGRGALWSPTDLFTELDLSGLSPTRRGTDALRLVLPLGDTGALDLVAAPDSDFSAARYATRLSGFVPVAEGGVDAALLACRDGGSGSATRAWSFGCDFKTDLVVGIDGEALYTVPDSGSGWLRAAGGADYSFAGFIVAAEYYYNGGGAEADSSAPGSHNAYACLSWKASDFATVSATCVAGLSERTCVAVLSADFDAAQNARVSCYARIAATGLGESAWADAAEAGASLKVMF